MFNNTEIAFTLKSDADLDRAYFLFKMIDNQPLVRIGTAVTNFALKANLPVEGLIRATVFDHFLEGPMNRIACQWLKKCLKKAWLPFSTIVLKAKKPKSSLIWLAIKR
jgi:hypothetical protein